MVEKYVACLYVKECADKSSTKCKKCRHNTLRNKEIHYFEEANDNPIPEINPRVTFDGPAEQTAGYKCPVCESFTNPYHVRDNR